MYDVIETDVLVVGGGGAASRAAMEAYLSGVDVVMAVKGGFGAIGTRGAGATSAARSEEGLFRAIGLPGIPQDSPRELYEDIVQIGLGMADPKLAEILANEAGGSARVLANWGVSFVRGPHGIRAHGVPLMSGLVSVVRKSGITVKERTMIVDLLVENGEAAGAIALDENGKITIIKAGAVVLATGGDAQLFKFNINPSCLTGDGYAMGYRAGAELFNMEFKQIFIATVYPSVNIVHRWAFDQRVKITNKDGREFVEDYLPPGGTVEDAMAQHALHNPFSTRDSYSRFIQVGMAEEVKAGRGSEHGGVYMDLRAANLNPYLQDWYKYRGIHWDTELVQVNSCHHCSDGGFRVDEHGQTTVPRLYGCGEVISGPHGADRLGGASLAASQVFGARAGRHAARNAYYPGRPVATQSSIDQKLERIRKMQTQDGDQKPGALREMLQKVAWEEMLTTRSETSLNKVLETVSETHELMDRITVENPLELVSALELQNLLVVGEMIARAGLLRKESRGAHNRLEYPEQDDANWLKAITLKKAKGSMELDTIALDPSWKPRTDDMGSRGWG
jgi:fumarate reductase (CoM/CoB) subunit A